MRKLETVVPVTISDKLQTQILILCSKIPRHEWSGTLFYTVEGEFGEPEFSITAQELYLQDIGSQAYTEYETGDPEFIQFLMKRADLREMRQGHIHSHNTMGVFFSGTDDDELNENSEFHNYYLSLIVNNLNEMKAKIAFRAEVDSETTSQMKYRNTNGTARFKTVTNTATTTYVYTYDCDITLPETIMSVYADMKRVEPKGRSASTNYYPSGTNKTWSNGNLFSPAEEEVVSYVPTEKDEEFFERHGYVQEEVQSPAKRWAEEQEGNKKKVSGKDAKKESVLRSSVDFLTRVVTMDPLRDSTLDEAIRDAVDDMYKRENRDTYMKKMSEKVPSIYKSSFPDLEQNAEHFTRTLKDSVDLMELFADQFPLFSRNVAQILDNYIKSME